MILALSGLPGGRLGGLLGASWAVLGHLGAILGRLGGFLDELEGILDSLGPSWRPSWSILGGLGGHLGTSGPSWSQWGPRISRASRVAGGIGRNIKGSFK